MPHIVIKLYPGRSETVKKELAEKTVCFFEKEMNADRKFFSVSVEEIPPEQWEDEVIKKVSDKNLYIKANFK